jgi:2-methylcitrate dehydratase PrpD
MRTALPARIEPGQALPRLAAFVAGVPAEAHPQAALVRGRLAMLDTIGCMVQGAATDTARNTLAAVKPWGQGPAPVIGTQARLAAPFAALANGTAAHARDLDDYTLTANDHPSAVLLPALMAVAADQEFSLGDILDAYLIGLEVIFRVGRAVNMGHYTLGWHTTSTIDGIGAAAAVSRLLGLDADRTASAMALTISMGAGMNCQFGTSAKPLHAGLSAKAAVVAGSLAANGLTGNPSVLDGPGGFTRLMVPDGAADFAGALDGLGESWGIETDGLGAKVYPSCGYTHRSIDTALALRAEIGAAAIPAIASVRVSLPDFHLAILPYGLPATPDQALFSTAWCVATALSKGRATPDDFEEAALADTATRALCDRITVTGRRPERPAINVDPDDPDTVEITLSDGSVLRRRCARWTGMPGADLTPERFVAKYEDCIAGAGERDTPRALPERLLNDPLTTPAGPLLTDPTGPPQPVAAQ